MKIYPECISKIGLVLLIYDLVDLNNGVDNGSTDHESFKHFIHLLSESICKSKSYQSLLLSLFSMMLPTAIPASISTLPIESTSISPMSITSFYIAADRRITVP